MRTACCYNAVVSAQLLRVSSTSPPPPPVAAYRYASRALDDTDLALWLGIVAAIDVPALRRLAEVTGDPFPWVPIWRRLRALSSETAASQAERFRAMGKALLNEYGLSLVAPEDLVRHDAMDQAVRCLARSVDTRVERP